MSKPELTVAIPTRNRFALLQRAVASVLCQTYTHFELIIIDNASSDETTQIEKVIDDTRVRYVRNSSDLGIIGNWNRAIEEARGEYLNIFHDDDVMHPTFLEKSVRALDTHPSVGFSFPLVRRVSLAGDFLNMWYDDYGCAGLLDGSRYIELTIEKERCISIAPSMVFRRSVHDVVGMYRQVYGFNTFDFNMWFKIAFEFDVFLIDEVLFDYTIHPGQMSERHWRQAQLPSGPIGMALEIIDAIARLLKLPYMQRPGKKEFLSEKLVSLTRSVSDLVRRGMPDF